MADAYDIGYREGRADALRLVGTRSDEQAIRADERAKLRAVVERERRDAVMPNTVHLSQAWVVGALDRILAALDAEPQGMGSRDKPQVRHYEGPPAAPGDPPK